MAWHFTYNNEEMVPPEGLLVVQPKWPGGAEPYRVYTQGPVACVVAPNGAIEGHPLRLQVSFGAQQTLVGVRQGEETLGPLDDRSQMWVLAHPRFAPTVAEVQERLGGSTDPLDTPHVAKAVAACLDQWFWLDTHPSQGEDLGKYGAFVQCCVEQLLFYGPLTSLLNHPGVTEVLVNGPQEIRIEVDGSLRQVPYGFAAPEHLAAVAERMLRGTGRRLSWLNPCVDCQLPDGSRFHAIAPPLSRVGICLSIRKFKKSLRDLDALCALGAFDETIKEFLQAQVQGGRNIVVSGGTSTGKTTFLNALASEIPGHHRVITVEDAAELQLAHPHVVPLEARPPNGEGLGEVSIRELVRNALRMRPDRIVVGECRGGEALDMLQAMNTGHDGSMTTVHANNGRGALLRLETLCLYANSGLPSSGLRQQIGTAIHYVIQLQRDKGTRRLVEIMEVKPSEEGAGDRGYITKTLVQYDARLGRWVWA